MQDEGNKENEKDNGQQADGLVLVLVLPYRGVLQACGFGRTTMYCGLLLFAVALLYSGCAALYPAC